MTRGSLPESTATTPPAPSRAPARAALGLALGLGLAVALATPTLAGPSGPVAAQVGQPTTDPQGPGGGGIGERPGGDRSTTTTDAPGTERSTSTTSTEAAEPGSPTTATTAARDEEGPGPSASAEADDVEDDDEGTSVVALVAVGLVGFVLGLLLAAVPLGAALARRKAARPAPAPALAPVPTGPAPAPAAGPVVGPAPTREEAQARSQRAALAEALMGLRDQLPSAALGDEAARALAAVGITEVRPDGQPFDPSRHHAVDQVETDDPARHNTVASTERPGYADGDRLVRQPEVVVARHGSGS